MLTFFSTLRHRLTALFGAVLLAVIITFVLYIYQASSNYVTASTQQHLQSIGKSIQSLLSLSFVERQREMQLLARNESLKTPDINLTSLRIAVNQLQQSNDEYAWIAVTNSGGRVLVASQGLFEGTNMQTRQWFVKGMQQAYIGDVHGIVSPMPLAAKTSLVKSTSPLRFIDFSAPIVNQSGQTIGVVASHVNWRVVQKLINMALPDKASASVYDVIMVNANNKILYPFSRIDEQLPPEQYRGYSSEGNSGVIVDDVYISYVQDLAFEGTEDLGWRLIIRKQTDAAFIGVQSLHGKQIVVTMGMILLSLMLVYRLAGDFSEPIERLALSAKRIANGGNDAVFSSSSNLLEVKSLSESLQLMLSKILQANSNLEQKVLERTAELNRANSELQTLSRIDSLTGIPNRLSGTEFIRQEFMQMQRGGARYLVILLDIDHFKQVNDNHGHAAGDKVLQHVSKVLLDSVRESDMLARFGGEEFLIVLPNTHSHAERFAEKIRAAVEASDTPVVHHLTVSIGVAMVSESDSSQEDAISRADAAMYQAKAKGRNTFCLSAELAGID